MGKVIHAIYLFISISILILWPFSIYPYLSDIGLSGYASIGFGLVFLQLFVVELVWFILYFFRMYENDMVRIVRTFSFAKSHDRLTANILFAGAVILFDLWPVIDAHKDTMAASNDFFGGINPIIFFIPPFISFILFVLSWYLSIKHVYKNKPTSWRVASILYRITVIILVIVIFYVMMIGVHGIDNYDSSFF